MAAGLLALAAACHGAPGQATTAPAAERIAEITRQLQAPRLVGGAFIQHRALQGLPRPLQASGRFVFWRDHGLYWETLAPFYQATTFTGSDVINWPAPSGPPQPAGQADPAQQHISGILLAVFSADLQRIEGLFDGRWQIDDGTWTLTLAPANAVVGRVIAYAELSGDTHLRQLTVASRAGDVNTMTFSEVAALGALPAAVCARFARSPGQPCPAAADTVP